jgi:hypothetical protein
MESAMGKRLRQLFQQYLPGLRLRALQATEDADHADRLTYSVYQYSLRHASELVSHPDPRSWLFRAMSQLLDQPAPLAA